MTSALDLTPIGVASSNAPSAVEAAIASAAQFALLGDPLRLQIVNALAREQLCTCHLIEITGAKQTTVSHHLRLLRQAEVITAEAAGRFTWYSITPGAFAAATDRLGAITRGGPVPRLRAACAG